MILVKENTEPPHNGACFAAATEALPPRLIAEVRQVPKRFAPPPTNAGGPDSDLLQHIAAEIRLLDDSRRDKQCMDKAIL